jgi:hypothetical protein
MAYKVKRKFNKMGFICFTYKKISGVTVVGREELTPWSDFPEILKKLHIPDEERKILSRCKAKCENFPIILLSYDVREGIIDGEIFLNLLYYMRDRCCGQSFGLCVIPDNA